MNIHHLIPASASKVYNWSMIQALQEEIEYLKSVLHQLNNKPKLINVRAGNKVNMISPSTILYIQADGNYSSIYLLDGKKFFTSKTLKYWTKVINNASFERIHKSTLINAHRVKCINKAEGSNTYIFEDGSSVVCKQRSVYSKLLYEQKRSIVMQNKMGPIRDIKLL